MEKRRFVIKNLCKKILITFIAIIIAVVIGYFVFTGVNL